MIKPLLIGMLLLIVTLIGNGQNSVTDHTLIKARFLVSEKLYAEALTTLKNHPFSGSDLDRTELAMGQALAGLGKYEESNDWLVRVAGEGTAAANYCLAKNYLALNDFPQAIVYLGKHLADKNHFTEKSLRMDPAFSKLENDRDWIHLWQTEWYSEAEQQTAECEYLIIQYQLDDAKALSDKILTRYPNTPRALFLLAKIHLLQKEDRQFRQALDRAWQLAGDNYPLMDEMLQFAMDNQLDEKANNMVSELIRKDQTNPQYLIDRALIRILDGKESAALQEFTSIENAGIAPAELYYQAGRKISSSMPGQAELYLNTAIDSGTLDARFYYARGVVRQALDKTGLALEDFAMSLDINPNQPDLFMERAQIRLDKGDTEGACHDWKKALDMGSPKAADLIYKYCRLP